MFRKMCDSKHVCTTPVTSSQISMLFSFLENWKKKKILVIISLIFIQYSADKGPYIKAIVFPVVTYDCGSWTIKKAERQRIFDAFELQCWRRLLKVPWTARRSNQSILREINPEYSLEGQRLKLKLQYFGHLMQKTTCWKSPDAGKDWGQKEKRASDDKMAGWHHQCNEHELGQTMGDGEGQGGLACCSPWSCKESNTTGLLNNNNKINWIKYSITSHLKSNSSESHLTQKLDVHFFPK